MKTAAVDKPKKPRRAPSIRERRLASLMIDNAGAEKPESVGSLMVRAGYSAATAEHPGRALARPSFQQLLSAIDDEKLLKRVVDIALDDDKRSSLAAVDMLFKLKDRFPANKLKTLAYNDELGDLMQEDGPEA